MVHLKSLVKKILTFLFWAAPILGAGIANRPKIEKFAGARVTIHTSNSYATVMEKVYGSVGTIKNAVIGGIVGNITAFDEANRLKFVSSVNNAVGPQGFMIFNEYNHGSWLPLFNINPGLGLKKVVVGNPVYATTMIKHDTSVAYLVPLEILVQEIPVSAGGGTDLVYNSLSSLTSVHRDKDLAKAANEIDGRFNDWVMFLAT